MAAKYPDSDDEYEKPVSKPKKESRSKDDWSLGLVRSMEDPKKVVFKDDLCVIIKDGYPKAHHHYLVLPKSDISCLRSLNRSHVSLLEHMLSKGLEHVSALKKEHGPLLSFKLGYHAVPSMTPLHMHVVSQDFDSPCVKRKEHWNSFTTEFFLDAETVIKMLEDEGQVAIDKECYNEYLKLPLKCHKCELEFPYLVKLKTHIKSHINPQ